jgi:hypothetical protein
LINKFCGIRNGEYVSGSGIGEPPFSMLSFKATAMRYWAL